MSRPSIVVFPGQLPLQTQQESPHRRDGRHSRCGHGYLWRADTPGHVLAVQAHALALFPIFQPDLDARQRRRYPLAVPEGDALV